MTFSSKYPLIALLSSVLLLSGCGDRGDGLGEAHDIGPEIEEHYATFKHIPPEWQDQLRSGELTQEEFDEQVEHLPNFFRFASIEDLPRDLEWEDGMDLPEFASPDAIKGGTSYGALQDFPRTLRHVGPDSNGSFRPMILDDVTLSVADRHPNVTEIGPKGFHHYPGLGKEWSIDLENQTVYVRLNPEARWSDGEPVTADDFLFMFFFFHSPYIQAPWYNNQYAENFTGITRYDEHTFAIHVARAKPDLASRALGLRPIPKHFFDELGPDYVQRYQWRFQPTTGPYVVREEDIRRGRSIALTRLEDWWAKDLKFWRYRFNYDRIQFNVIRDISNMFESFRRGDLDKSGLVNLPDYWYDRLPDDHELVRNGYIQKVEFYNEIPRPTYGLWINQAQPLLNNRDIRIGLHYATNFERVIQEYFRGDYERMNTTSDGYGEFSHPTLTARPFDVDQALEHFARAGFEQRGSDGILVNENGRRLSFTVTTGYRHFEDLLVILREEAARAGVEFRLDILDGTSGWKKVQEKNHEIAFTAFGTFPEMYPRYWETYHGINAYDEPYLADGSPNPDREILVQTNNLVSMANPELDRMIDAYRRSNDAEEMMELAFAMEELIHEEGPFIPGWVQPFYRMAHWRWIRYPDDFNVKISSGAGQYFLDWLDPEIKAEVEQARRDGRALESGQVIYDQFRTD